MRRTIGSADLNDYRYFAEAVAHGGFAAASRALKIPKSKLSRRISGLEARLGVRLIERSTRHFRVTELGRSFYERCRAILDVVEDAEAIVEVARTEPRGDLRFSIPTGLVEIVAPTLPQFLARFPTIRLQMFATDRPVDLFQENLDLAIRVRTKLDDSAVLSMRSLGISRKILVSNQQFADFVGGDISRLATLPTLSTSEDPGEMEWALVCQDGRSQKVRHDPRMRCSDFAAVRKAAAAGAGIALLPDHTCREQLQNGSLFQVLPEWRSPEGIVHAVFMARKGVSPTLRALIDHLVRAFAPEVLST
jgi:DNA-binding transcriptional LysR family regulator